LNITEENSFVMELAILEICINIIRYAYPKEKGYIRLKSWDREGKVFFEIRDDGVPFDPRSVKKPDISEIIKDEKTGGLGIFLTRELMDGFEYRREKDQNILIMYKNLQT